MQCETTPGKIIYFDDVTKLTEARCAFKHFIWTSAPEEQQLNKYTSRNS